jgi:LPXTG-motif cell wall-anchored protein
VRTSPLGRLVIGLAGVLALVAAGALIFRRRRRQPRRPVSRQRLNDFLNGEVIRVDGAQWLGPK